MCSSDLYKLVPLPMTDAIYDEDGERLPATYANFLIINGAVLVPTYGVPQDAEALAPTVGRQARAGENVPRTARPGLVARRWGSA